jgi:uncharacterized protein YceH (UPF0502 family)
LNIFLTPHEARVIGCLIEKEITTPEQYPLSLNALTNACNQKSSRDPVMALDERVVQETVDALVKKRLISEKTGFGSRVAKYQHRFCNTDFGDLRLTQQELGVICVLLLRGPQTPGELRTRTDRLCKFGDVQEVEAVLKKMMERDDGPFVIRLPREAGKRESRYAHLFCGEVHIPEDSIDEESAAGVVNVGNDRLDKIEQAIAELHREIEEIKSKLGVL